MSENETYYVTVFEMHAFRMCCRRNEWWTKGYRNIIIIICVVLGRKYHCFHFVSLSPAFQSSNGSDNDMPAPWDTIKLFDWVTLIGNSIINSQWLTVWIVTALRVRTMHNTSGCFHPEQFYFIRLAFNRPSLLVKWHRFITIFRIKFARNS